jgi:NAD(P)-dependent dehydrogenase (short-subunit alcohol dehydrogenase family)
MIRLDGKKAIVIGGSTGIGFETARLLVEAGASVTITSRSQPKLEAAAQAIGGPVTIRAFDGRVAADMAAFFAEAGSIDHLVLTLNTGGGVAPFGELHDERFRRVFENKFWPYVNAVRCSLNTLAPDGSITFVAGGAARKAVRGTAGIAATNGALLAMVGPLALQLAPRRVNAVTPGVVDTPYWHTVDEEKRREMFVMAASQTPAGRVGTAQDVAQAVLYLITNTFTTGAILDCDGGLHIT